MVPRTQKSRDSPKDSDPSVPPKCVASRDRNWVEHVVMCV